MKPLPNIEDEAAMLLRGRRSALAAARNDAEIVLRDEYTLLQSTEWPDLSARADKIRALADRLHTLAEMWAEANRPEEVQ